LKNFFVERELAFCIKQKLMASRAERKDHAAAMAYADWVRFARFRKRLVRRVPHNL